MGKEEALRKIAKIVEASTSEEKAELLGFLDAEIEIEREVFEGFGFLHPEQIYLGEEE